MHRKRLEIRSSKAILDFGKGWQTKIRLIDAVKTDRFVVIHAREGSVDLMSGSLEGGGEETFDRLPNSFRLRIGHFQINLGEFGLTIGAQVFVAETANDLKILVEARDHENLLEKLGRLRQRIKRSGLDAAGNEVVPRAFGSGAGHERRLNFEEALGSQVIADSQCDLMPQLNVELHCIAAQVDVAIFQPHFLIRQRSIGGEKGRVLGFIQDAQFVSHQFNFAGGNVLVDGVGIAQLDGANGGNYELVAQQFRFVVDGGVRLLADDDLRDAGTIAHVDKDEIAKIAATVYPSHENSFFAGIGGAQRAAHVSTLQVAEEIEQRDVSSDWNMAQGRMGDYKRRLSAQVTAKR